MEMVGEPSVDFIHYRMIGYRFLKALGNLDKKEEKKYCINFAFPPLSVSYTHLTLPTIYSV